MTNTSKTTAASRQDDIAELMTRVGHTFNDPRLLQAALTHPSLSGANRQKRKGGAPYERLEFLGDRVLGLIIAEWLYQQYPDANEGDLAKRHAALVNRDALRQVAIEIGLGSFIRVARGENVTAARKNLATLSDALEALIGALYLDGGLLVASAFIHRYWQKDIAIAEAPADPKTALQEWAQAQALPLPQYKVLEHTGPAHAPRFVIEVSLKGHPPMTASGDSKRAAQKAAAASLLNHVLSNTHTGAGGKA
ncbi:MAG: ribonuclease III [Alphaproteobacteria bacterium]|nr:ribonuclease III [Alphaproteobacteria bacterium]MBV8549382.1 ribonuclease III [Alphaproteobacteria bacterium]